MSGWDPRLIPSCPVPPACGAGVSRGGGTAGLGDGSWSCPWHSTGCVAAVGLCRAGPGLATTFGAELSSPWRAGAGTRVCGGRGSRAAPGSCLRDWGAPGCSRAGPPLGGCVGRISRPAALPAPAPLSLWAGDGRSCEGSWRRAELWGRERVSFQGTRGTG